MGLTGGANIALVPWNLGAHTVSHLPRTGGLFALHGGFQWNAVWAFEGALRLLPQAAVTSGNAVLAYDLGVVIQPWAGRWVPFALAGLGAYHSTGDDLGADFDPAFHLGVGFRGLVLPWLAVRLQVRDVLSDGIRGPSNNLEFSAGLELFPTALLATAQTDSKSHTAEKDPFEQGPVEPVPVSAEGEKLPAVVEALAKLTGTIPEIQFEPDTADLAGLSYSVLDETVETLNRHPLVRLRIEVHTEPLSTTEQSLELSKNRARAVRDFLTQKGIAPIRLEHEGYGDTQPIADNATPEGRAQNRRVTFRLLSQPPELGP